MRTNRDLSAECGRQVIARVLHVEPGRRLDPEDSPAGLAAAHAAGMSVVDVRSLVRKSAELRNFLGHVTVHQVYAPTKGP